MAKGLTNCAPVGTNKVKQFMKRTGGKFGRQSEGREDSEPLLKDPVGTHVRTPAGISEEAWHKMDQEVLRIEAHLEDPSCLESGPDSDLLKQIYPLVEEAMSKSFPWLGGQSVHEGAYFCLEASLDALLETVRGKSAQLQSAVTETFHHCVFPQLNQALQCNIKEDEILKLLQKVSEVYLSKSVGCPNIPHQTSKAVDLLLLSDWVQRAQNKYLDTAQNVLSERLERTLLCEEKYRRSHTPEEEEDFLRLQLDVEQLLTGFINRAKTVSKVLGQRVQKVCYQELCNFLERYVKSEMKQLKAPVKLETYSRMHQFRTFNTCMALKGCVEIMAGEGHGVHAHPVVLLEEMQAVALDLLLQEPSRLAEASIKKYFKKGHMAIEDVIKEVREYFENLPRKEGQKAYKILVDMAYQHVASMYLRHMMLQKHKTLQKRWGDLGQRVMQDVEGLQRTFSQLNPGEPSLNSELLLKVAEILLLSDVEALKITGYELLKDGSPELLRALLHWRGGLSRRQVTEVLRAGRGESASPEQSGTRARSSYRWIICCCW